MRNNDHSGSTADQCLPKLSGDCFSDARFCLHQERQQGGPQKIHDQRLHHLGGVFDLLLDLPLQHRGCDAICRSRLVSADLSRHSLHARRVGGGDPAAHLHDIQPRAQGPVRAAQENRAVDMAAVDVRLHHRRVDLPPAVPDFPSVQGGQAGFSPPAGCRATGRH